MMHHGFFEWLTFPFLEPHFAAEDGGPSQGDLAHLSLQQLFVSGPLGSHEPRRTARISGLVAEMMDENGGSAMGKSMNDNGSRPNMTLLIFVDYLFTGR